MASTADVALIEDDTGNSQDNDKPLRNDYNPSLKDGRQAWLVCVGGFLLQVLIVGVLHVFGVFFVQFIDEFGKSRAEVAWIGSAAYGLSMAFGPITGLLVERYGARPITMVGCFICAVSALLTSFVVEMETMFASFSVLYGLGTSLAYTPTMTIAQDYFDKYVSIATGIMTAGSSTGTLILAPLTQALIDSVGWRNTMRAFVGTCLFSMCCAMLFKPLGRRRHKTAAQRLKAAPSAHHLLHEFALWKSRAFILWTLALMCVMFGYYIPYVHLVSYAQDVGVHPDQGSKLIMCLGAATAIGRISFGKIVQYGFMSRLHMHQLSMVVTGAGVMMLPLIKSFPLLVMYVWIVGLVDGCFVVLLPLMTATLVGADKAAIAWGFFVGACSITFTLGPPVAGWIYDSSGSYNLAFHVSGIPIIIGALLLFLMPWAQRTSRSTNAFVEVAEPERMENGDDDHEECIYMNRSTVSGAHHEDAQQGTSNSRYAVAEISKTQKSLLLPDAAYLLSNARQVDCKRSTESLPTNLMAEDLDGESVNSANLIDITDSIEAGQQAISRQRMFELYRRERLTSGRVRAHTWTDNTYNPAPGEPATITETPTSVSSTAPRRGSICVQNADSHTSSSSISPFLSPHPSQETVQSSLTSIPAITPTATPTASQLYLMALRQATTSPIPPSDESSSAILSSSYPSPTGSSLDMMVSLYNNGAMLSQQDSICHSSNDRSSSPPTICNNAADTAGPPVRPIAQRLSPPQATSAASSGTVTTTSTTTSRSFVNAVQLETIPEMRHSQPTQPVKR